MDVGTTGSPATAAAASGRGGWSERWRRFRDRRLRGIRVSDLLSVDRSVLVQALKIALSAGLAWALAQWILGSPSPIWAPITASLIAVLTVRDSIWDAGQKVLAVVVGLVVAIWLGGLIGLHAWSISVIVAVGFLAGKILRLPPGAAAQIPITGLFVLALGSDLIAERFLDTLIGAATAVLVNLAIAPPNHVNAAAKSMIALADDVVDELNEMSAGIASRWSLRQAVGWLEAARRHRGPAMMAADDVRQAEQSLQLRPGRAAWMPALVRLQRATDTLLVVEVQVRVIARTLRDTAEKVPTTDERQPPMPMASGLLRATGDAIEAFAHSVVALGRDAHAEVIGGPARRAVARARERIDAINGDLGDLLAANLSRGIYLGALVVETSRILDELESGLDSAAGASGGDGVEDDTGAGPKRGTDLSDRPDS